MLLLFAFFKAASLDGHMAFLVAVHYVIFVLVLILYASLENKFFFFFFLVKRSLLLNAFAHNSDLVTFSSSVLTYVSLQIGQKISRLPKRVAVHLLKPLLTVTRLSDRFSSYASNSVSVKFTLRILASCLAVAGCLLVKIVNITDGCIVQLCPSVTS